MPFPNPDTQFKPGNNANPGGRPRGRSIVARARELILDTEFAGKPLPGGKQVADIVAHLLVKAALKGDRRDIEALLDRVEGRPKQSVEIGGPEGGPVRICTVEVVKPDGVDDGDGDGDTTEADP